MQVRVFRSRGPISQMYSEAELRTIEAHVCNLNLKPARGVKKTRQPRKLVGSPRSSLHFDSRVVRGQRPPPTDMAEGSTGSPARGQSSAPPPPSGGLSTGFIVVAVLLAFAGASRPTRVLPFFVPSRQPFDRTRGSRRVVHEPDVTSPPPFIPSSKTQARTCSPRSRGPSSTPTPSPPPPSTPTRSAARCTSPSAKPDSTGAAFSTSGTPSPNAFRSVKSSDPTTRRPPRRSWAPSS